MKYQNGGSVKKYKCSEITHRKTIIYRKREKMNHARSSLKKKITKI